MKASSPMMMKYKKRYSPYKTHSFKAKNEVDASTQNGSGRHVVSGESDGNSDKNVDSKSNADSDKNDNSQSKFSDVYVGVEPDEVDDFSQLGIWREIKKNVQK